MNFWLTLPEIRVVGYFGFCLLLIGYAWGGVTGPQCLSSFNTPIYGIRLGTMGKAVGSILRGMDRTDLYPMGDPENVLIIDMQPQIYGSSAGFVRLNQRPGSTLGIECGPGLVANGVGESCPTLAGNDDLAPIR